MDSGRWLLLLLFLLRIGGRHFDDGRSPTLLVSSVLPLVPLPLLMVIVALLLLLVVMAARRLSQWSQLIVVSVMMVFDCLLSDLG